MKILFLTNNDNSLILADWLKIEVKENVILYKQNINIVSLEKISPDFIISYNYKYKINKEITSLYKNKIINLHISFLPWNRGVYPNFWSFIHNTPKGVTIHYIDENIDSGDILIQEACSFDENNETFSSTYNMLQLKIQNLFMKNWVKIKKDKFVSVRQNLSEGSINTLRKNKKLIELIGNINWNINIKQFKDKYLEIILSADFG